MKKLQILFFFVLLLITNSVQSQELFDIKDPGSDFYKRCNKCLTSIATRPREIQFGVQRDDDNNLFFVVTHKTWFNEILKKGSDGIAIDIVSKERYDCSKEKLNDKSIVRGDLQKPIYLKELKKNMLITQYGEVIVHLGKVPKKYVNEEVEFNILFIKNKYLCHYNTFIDIKAYRWDLLDMGMYLDTLTYKSKLDTSLTEQESYILQHKVLKFEIPFEKNKSEYSPEDIKPLYDSLRITDFNITKINIRAYSSVEGNLERNIELQELRAKSIVNALQEFQEPTIITEIKASENWVEFLNDIALTSHSKLSELTKAEIKEKLNSRELVRELEPYLEKHRKAIVILELQKKDKYENMSTEGLVELFKKSISDKNLEQAIEIQNSIFEKVKDNEIPASFIDDLEIPQQKEFGLLLNKNSIFKFLMDEVDVYNTLLELKSLEDLLPKDGHVKYNICALKFKVWILGEQAINQEDFKKEIMALRKYGVSSKLVKRMLINHSIVMCEYHMILGDYVNKDKSLKYIYTNFKYVPLSDVDYLSLAQYFTSYAKYDWSIKLLLKKVKRIDVDEDLLFYYLNLTLMDEKLTKRSDYRTIMLNAINLNRNRFCEIFDPRGQGGVSFQLLENEYLRKTYCENCE